MRSKNGQFKLFFFCNLRIGVSKFCNCTRRGLLGKTWLSIYPKRENASKLVVKTCESKPKAILTITGQLLYCQKFPITVKSFLRKVRRHRPRSGCCIKLLTVLIVIIFSLRWST